MADPALLKAIQVGLTNAALAGHDSTTHIADHVGAVLDAYGLVLPAGVTIGAVWRVRQDPGYRFTDRGEAERWARDGGQDGRHGDVEQAWRIQADGVDVTTTWKAAS
jgi:hypothetical protein